MSYISAIWKGEDVIVWERTEDGERVEQVYRAPYYFYVDDDETGDYETIFGTKVSKFEFTTSSEYKRAKAVCEERGHRAWESDIPPELRVLSNNYYNLPAPKLHKTFYDIEVNYDPEIGFAGVSDSYAPINSIALFHEWSGEYIVLAVPPEAGWTVERLRKEAGKAVPLPANVRIVLCADEKELLLNFVAEIEDSDIICGWNSDLFDTPYVGKRLIKNFGERALSKLDFRGATPRWREIKARTTQKVLGETLDLQGRVNLDYMRLYQKYEPGERASYRLAAIQEVVGLDLPKLEYNGTLHDLYYKDFGFFVRYNIRDTEILGGFEKKLAYVELANQMVHISCGLFSHVLGTLKLAEYATINHCHYNLKQVVPNFVPTPPEEDRQIEGAFVMEPKIGMHEWIGSIDINSLYPSAIRAINISPETLRGQFEEKAEAADAIAKGTSMPLILRLENGDTIEKTGHEFRELLLKRKWAVSGYGTVFDQTLKGIIPTILEEWYAKRKVYQAKKKDAEKAGNKEEAGYYDRLQYVYKIKLNSFYGALTNLYFRFYDIRMGESVTGTGRRILRHQIAKVNEILGDEAVIYGDTDSAYFSTYAENKREAVAIADAVGDKVNDSYQGFMQETFLCQPTFDDIIMCGREIVSDRGIFVEKKRYILHVVDKEGKASDEMKIMGLDTKKTILPKHVSDVLNKFIERLLKGEDWGSVAESVVAYKEELATTKDITRLGLPKGINDIEYFYDKTSFIKEAKKDKRTGKTKVSGHVRAALHYNRSLKEFDDKVSMPIKDGMKIRVFYLMDTPAPYKLINGEEIDLTSIALPTDLEVVPQWFLKNFRVDIEAHIDHLVDHPLNNILKAIGKEPPSKQSLLVDSLLSF
jgi:DNA polymerase elongation subunit (family B)